MFKVGQKVVCIINYTPYPGVTFPIKGEIYTIRETDDLGYTTGLRFEEIVNPVVQWMDGLKEAAFGARDFRPIDYTFGEQVCEYLEVMTEPELV